MAWILIFIIFCVFALDSTNSARANVTPAPYTPTTAGPAWETRDLAGWMISVMPDALVSFRSVALSNVTGITVCLRAVTEKKWLLEDELHLTFGEKPAVYIHKYSSYYDYQLQVAYSYQTFKVYSMVPVRGVRSLWKSRCLTWDSSSGMAQLWFDGMMSVRKGLSRGTVFSGQAELTLLQFEGQVTDVYMWASVLSVQKLHRFLYHQSVPSGGSALNWTQMECRTSGYVVLEPAYPKRLPAGPAKCNRQKRMKALRKRQTQDVV